MSCLVSLFSLLPLPAGHGAWPARFLMRKTISPVRKSRSLVRAGLSHAWKIISHVRERPSLVRETPAHVRDLKSHARETVFLVREIIFHVWESPSPVRKMIFRVSNRPSPASKPATTVWPMGSYAKKWPEPMSWPVTAPLFLNGRRSRQGNKVFGIIFGAGWCQASLPDVEGGILPPGNSVIRLVGCGIFGVAGGRGFFSAGLGSPALRPARMSAATGKAGQILIRKAGSEAKNLFLRSCFPYSGHR